MKKLFDFIKLIMVLNIIYLLFAFAIADTNIFNWLKMERIGFAFANAFFMTVYYIKTLIND